MQSILNIEKNEHDERYFYQVSLNVSKILSLDESPLKCQINLQTTSRYYSLCPSSSQFSLMLIYLSQLKRFKQSFSNSSAMLWSCSPLDIITSLSLIFCLKTMFSLQILATDCILNNFSLNCLSSVVCYLFTGNLTAFASLLFHQCILVISMAYGKISLLLTRLPSGNKVLNK